MSTAWAYIVPDLDRTEFVRLTTDSDQPEKESK